MDTAYISPHHARVPLSTEADLRAAVSTGLLEETHFLDLKREISPGKGPNRETARDLASFAVDGGTILLGVGEVGDGELELCPQPLAGVAERVEQLAAMIPDPPLAVISRLIPSVADPAVGYLVIHIPPSPSAPHMVDGRYLGRGDKTKRYLTDAEVLRLHQRRTANEVDGSALLDIEFARDLFDDINRRNAHLFLVAQPLASRPDALASITDVDSMQPLLNFRQTALTPELHALLSPLGAADISPGIQEMQTLDRRAAGTACSTHGIAPGRLRRADDGYDDRESAAELEVQDSGGLCLRRTSKLFDAHYARPVKGATAPKHRRSDSTDGSRRVSIVTPP